MEPTSVWLLLCIVLAVIFFSAEMFIPSHGILSVLAIASLMGAVALCFLIDRWLGIGAMIAFIVLGPIGLSAGFSIWQRTPLGKRFVLTATGGPIDSPTVLVGTVGTAMTELRPMGMGEFAGTRIEVRGEMGQIIRAGAEIEVIALDGRVATVRPVDTVI